MHGGGRRRACRGQGTWRGGVDDAKEAEVRCVASASAIHDAIVSDPTAPCPVKQATSCRRLLVNW